jgi:hypothetical protein
MSVFLKIVADGIARDAAVIAAGRALVIGRSDSADLPFPNDSMMSSRHASIQIRGSQCLLQDLGSTNGTTLNGDPFTSGEIQVGDLFQCGSTCFQIEWSHRATAFLSPGALVGSADPSAAVKQTARKGRESLPPELLQDSGFVAAAADEIVGTYRLRQSVKLTPEANETPPEFLGRLMQLRNLDSALEFLAFALPRRCAVAWLVRSARTMTELTPEEQTMISIAGEWLKTPVDSLRRKLFAECQTIETARPVHWIGSAAFFSSGSIAPEGSPVVAPGPKVAGQCVFAGITMTVLAAPPTEHSARRKQVLEMGLQLGREGLQAAGITSAG